MDADKHSLRKPVALANWKMAMTVSEGLAFIQDFIVTVKDIANVVQIILCPPYTAIYPLSQALRNSPIELGAQNMFSGPGITHTGEISAPLIAEAGGKWVMLGHWEARRRLNESDAQVNEKMHAALAAGLRPILLIGEAAHEQGQGGKVLKTRLPALFKDCDPKHAAKLILIYEPEWTIGAEVPASAQYVADCCAHIRDWIEQEYGSSVAGAMRLVYGGSVTPEHTNALLVSAHVDGLGAGRKGRDPVAFGRITRQIAQAKGLLKKHLEPELCEH